MSQSHLTQSQSYQANNMISHSLLVALTLLAFTSCVLATDPNQLQDFCVGANFPKPEVFVNGNFCKDPALASPEDFFFSGLNVPGNTSNQLGVAVTAVNAMNLPGLNTLGISFARIDYAPYGLNPLHTHPRATEILVVLKGVLYVGFVTSNPDNRFFSKYLHPGDVFVFPQGLIHFQFNVARSNAIAFAGLSSQNPGVITIANAVFGSNPGIPDDILAKNFQVENKVIDLLQLPFGN